jgi:hypothetical protein
MTKPLAEEPVVLSAEEGAHWWCAVPYALVVQCSFAGSPRIIRITRTRIIRTIRTRTRTRIRTIRIRIRTIRTRTLFT